MYLYLSFFSRHGWYMPSFLVNSQWEKEHKIIDHWRALQLDQVSQMFAMEQEKLQLLQEVLTLRHLPSNYSYCQYKGCHRGLYSMPHCRHKNKNNCPLLLSGDPGKEPSFFFKNRTILILCFFFCQRCFIY